MKNKFRLALWATVIPTVGLSVVSLVVTAISVRPYYNDTGLTIWLVAAGFWVVAFVAAITYSLKGIRNIAKGIWIGIGIGIVPMSAILLANFIIGC